MDICNDCGLYYEPGKDGKHIDQHMCFGKIKNIKDCTCYSCDCGMRSCWICCSGKVPKTYLPCNIHKKCLYCGSGAIDINNKHVGPLWNPYYKFAICYWCRLTMDSRG